MNIAICDDEFEQVNIIKCYLDSFFQLNPTVTVDTFQNSADLLSAVARGKRYDMLFLDIEIGEVNGTDVAFDIREHDKRVVIFFISSYPQYVTRAFKVDAFQFLVKPVDQTEFHEEVKRALDKLKAEDFRYCVSNKEFLYSLRPNNIIYLEAYHRRLFIQTLDKRIDICGRMSDEEKRLEPFGFVRVHQGYLVNMNHIVSIGERQIQCTQNFCIPVSARKGGYVMRQYNLFLSAKSI